MGGRRGAVEPRGRLWREARSYRARSSRSLYSLLVPIRSRFTIGLSHLPSSSFFPCPSLSPSSLQAYELAAFRESVAEGKKEANPHTLNLQQNLQQEARTERFTQHAKDSLNRTVYSYALHITQRMVPSSPGKSGLHYHGLVHMWYTTDQHPSAHASSHAVQRQPQPILTRIRRRRNAALFPNRTCHCVSPPPEEKGDMDLLTHYPLYMGYRRRARRAAGTVMDEVVGGE